jgi:hypothetical protein
LNVSFVNLSAIIYILWFLLSQLFMEQ